MQPKLRATLNRAKHKWRYAVNHGVDVDPPRSVLLVLTERLQLPCEVTRLRCGLDDLCHVRRLRRGKSLSGEDFRISLDDGQKIVEFVCDTGRELTDGLHLLRMVEPCFEPAPFRYIFNNDLQHVRRFGKRPPA